ncbi:putative membrane protein YfcA [Constrictibacter sp. MBR-5]|jgi:uncharacterized membrane protein YfcA|uniref:sulfite exporter TauE/SafE family protein n=1 Tax=Constrictibacter sp. MBR-5 TaxID=3156467 RepID=UPI0033908A76
MQIYLPIAEISENVIVLLGLGWAIGFLSGLFGVGGGFLLTPILIFLGVPPPVAVASSANQLVGTSIAGVLAHWRRKTIDFRMGGVLLAGGIAGSGLGVVVFDLLRQAGQVDLVVQLCYIIMLGSIGAIMFVESLNAILKRRRPGGRRRKLHTHIWLHGLPLKMRFPRSRLYISVFMPLGVGFVVGLLAAIMGVGGGFIMVPAMIYLIGMPTSVVAGTSLFQILFVTANVTFLQAMATQTVDVLLALILLVGSVLGVQIGARMGGRLPAEQFRFLLAVMVLAVCGKIFYDLVARPEDIYSIAANLPG